MTIACDSCVSPELVDYEQRWSELEASRNPFATVVMAHLKAIETRNNRNARLQSKLALTKRLYELGFEREDIINLFQFIDWIMSLPAELEREFWQEFRNFEESRRMPYITSVERNARREELLEAIELGLELKFGSEGLNLMPEISQIEDIEQLRAIKSGLKTVQTMEELRSIYQSQTG